jgi:putative heme-binding domain-containing protein
MALNFPDTPMPCVPTFLGATCFCLLLTVAAPLPAQSFPHIVEDEPLSPAEQQKRFKLPPGFEIQLVAAEPQIAKPINLNFNARGQLLVTQSVEYPIASEAKGRDALLLLVDRDSDGRFETTAGSLDGLNIPIGVTPVAGDDVVLFSIPNIYRARDEDGDGRFEKRDKLLGPFGFEDTHGLNNGFTRWLDGWIYACHGFRNSSSVAGADGHRVTMQSGNTYRFRDDGSRIEQWTWGQVNPFGMAFDPLGDCYTADCHSKPMYQLLRGARYPSFGKPHDGLGFGPTLIEHSHGSTGIGGIVYYAAEHFPPKYRDVIFVGNPITHRVNCDRLGAFDSTYRGEQAPDFLVCDDPWFRPVDLQLGPDGALYVADFYNCIIGHYEVPLDHPKRDRRRGRIWRIIYTGSSNEEKSDPPGIPDLRSLDLAALWSKLADPNLTVRTLATHEIVDRFPEEGRKKIRALLGARATAEQRAHAVWICERLGVLDAELIRRLAHEPESLPRVHLAKALADRAEWRSEDDGLDIASLMREMLTDDNAFVRRAAADALGRHPHADNIAPLLQLWDRTPPQDTHLIHTVRMALRDQLRTLDDYDALTAGYADGPSEYSRLLDVSLGVRDAASAEFVLAGLQKVGPNWPRRSEALQYALIHLGDDRLKDGVAFVEAQRGDALPAGRQAELLRAASHALEQRGAPFPDALRNWSETLATSLLASNKQQQQQLGVAFARDLKLREAFVGLLSVAGDPAKSMPLRGDALEACAAVNPVEAVAPIADLLRDIRQPAALRTRAARALTSINRKEARDALATQLPLADFQLAVEIATGLGRNRDGAEQLLESIKQGKASPQLLMRREVQLALRVSGLPDWQERIDGLTEGVTPLDKQIAKLLDQRRRRFQQTRPDLARGAEVFKKTCAACHRLGKEGEKIGPELDGIGHRGLARLLEDVLDPNRVVDPAFHTTVVQTSDGRVLSGLALESEGKLLVLVDREGKQFRIPLAEIGARRTLPVSPMPANLAEAVPAEDLNHLLAYLLSQRQ